MEANKLGSGDNNNAFAISTTRSVEEEFKDKDDEEKQQDCEVLNLAKDMDHDKITSEIINDNEIKLKERIAQCKIVIESLKCELNSEKSKLEEEKKTRELVVPESRLTVDSDLNSDIAVGLTHTPDLYSSCVGSRIYYDENLMEYEKQLQIYQNTLNMAQLEKKNAIRKQMLAKAYRLKLMEVENQCNIELLRVKQSLQCLEPLQMIVSKWKCNRDDNAYDLNNYELAPRFPELNSNNSSVDFNSYKAAIDLNFGEPSESGKNDDKYNVDF